MPSKPPTNVRLVSNTLSSITVSWGPIPKDGRNGVIRGFIVSYREEGAMTWTKRDVKLVYSQVLTNLATGKQYYVRVAGYTKVGRGSKFATKSIVVGGIIFHIISRLQSMFICYFIGLSVTSYFFS